MAAVSKNIQKRITASVFAGQSLFSAATILTFTLTSIVAADLSGSDSLAGLPSTAGLISRAILAYPIGWLLDQFGRRVGLSFGFGIGLVGALIAAWSIINGSFAGFLIGSALIGGSRASAEQSRYIAAEIFPTKQQSQIIGWVVFAGTIGAIGGPALVAPANTLAESWGINGYAGPFLAGGLLLLIGAIEIIVFLRPDPQDLGRMVAATEAAEKAEQGLAPEGEARPLSQIFKHPLALLAVAAMAIGQLVMTMIMVITSLHMSHHGHTVGAISLVILAHTLGMYGLSGFTGGFVQRFGRLTMIAAGALILMAAAILAPISSALVPVMIALFLLGLGWNFSFIAGSSLLSGQLVSAERGRAQGAGDMVVAIGAGIGGLISGFLFDLGDILAVSLVGLVFSMALLGMVLWMRLGNRVVPLSASGQE